MKSRIEDKLKELKGNLDELESFLPKKLEDYTGDSKTRAACERAFEKVIEAVIDISLLMIRHKKLEMPSDDSSVFTIIGKKGILPEKLVKNLLDAKGMRNFIVHQYDKIDDELVYEALAEKLTKDISGFMKSIKKAI